MPTVTLPPPVVVVLTAEEVAQAHAAGDARNRNSRNMKFPDGAVADSRAIDPLGAVGELALSKHTGLPWWTYLFTQAEFDNPALRPAGGRDVGHLDVRSTARENGCLILHKKDPDEVPFVLAYIKGRTVTLAGWVYAREGKVPSHWRTNVPWPAFFVPPHKLRPMSTLPGVPAAVPVAA